MLYLSHKKETVTTVEAITEFKMEDKYYWSSRSVYAVKFKEDIYKGKDIDDKIWHEIEFIEVQFENNVIRHEKTTWCKEHPLRDGIGGISRNQWVKDLFHAFTHDRYFDSRSKEQFETDFDGVISRLNSILHK